MMVLRLSQYYVFYFDYKFNVDDFYDYKELIHEVRKLLFNPKRNGQSVFI